jgi:membrane protease YdiL (CAAX protease family)
MTNEDPKPPRASLTKRVAAFLILLALYQAAEGIGGRLLNNGLVANLFMLSSVVAAPLVSRWLGWTWLGAYALDLKRGAGAIVLAGVIAAAIAKTVALTLGARAGVYAIGGFVMQPDGAAVALTLAIALVTTAVPSVAEDIITRGFWLRGAEIKWSGAAFILASSTIYLLNHVWRLGDGPVEWLRIFAFGLAYAAAAWRWQTLWAAFGLHWGWNLSNTLLDAFVRVDAASAQQSGLVSAAAHLILAALIVAGPWRKKRRAGT